MKIRNGFVSNSSSSSFTCSICEREESGYDLCLSDIGMGECSHGHYFCKGHMNDLSLEDKRDILIKYRDEVDDIIMKGVEGRDGNLIVMAFDKLMSEIDGWYECPDDICPCCTLKSVDRSTVYAYALYLLGKTRKDLEQDIRSKFSTRKEVWEEIRKK